MIIFNCLLIYIHNKRNLILCHVFRHNQGPRKITYIVKYSLCCHLTITNFKISVRGSNFDYFRMPIFIIHTQYKCDKSRQ